MCEHGGCVQSDDGHNCCNKAPKHGRAEARADRRALYGHKRTAQLGLRDLRALQNQRIAALRFPRSHPRNAILPSRIYRLYGIDSAKYRDLHSRKYWRASRMPKPATQSLVSTTTDPNMPLEQDSIAQNIPSTLEGNFEGGDGFHKASRRLLTALALPPPVSTVQVMLALPEDNGEGHGEKRSADEAALGSQDSRATKQSKYQVVVSGQPDQPQCDSCQHVDKDARKYDGKNEGEKICLECFKDIQSNLCSECGNEIKKSQKRNHPDNTEKKVCRNCRENATKAADVCDGCGKTGPGRRKYPYPSEPGKRICGTCKTNITNAADVCDGCGKTGPGRRKYPYPSEPGKRICGTCKTNITNAGDLCDGCGKTGSGRRAYPHPSEPGKRICKTCKTNITNAGDLCDGCGKTGSGRRAYPHPSEPGKRICGTCKTNITNAGDICDGCRKTGSGRRAYPHPSEPGKRICKTCKRNIKKAGDICDGCGEDMSPADAHMHLDKRLCATCYHEVIAWEKAESMNAIDSSTPSDADSQHSCVRCGTHDPAIDWFIWKAGFELCEFCKLRAQVGARNRPSTETLRPHSSFNYEALVQLASRSWFEMHPNFDHSKEDVRIPRASQDYMILSRASLEELLYKIGTSPRRSIDGSTRSLYKNEASLILMISDAWNGIQPHSPPQQASKYDGLPALQIRTQAVQRGAPAKPPVHLSSGDDATDTEIGWFINYLIQKDAEDSRDYWTDVEGGSNLVRTDNGGLVGPPELLMRLDQTIWEGALPTDTPSAGLLCGASALEITLNSIRARSLQYLEPEWRDVPRLERDGIMCILFANYYGGMTVGDDDVGEPTDAYDKYINDREPRDVDPDSHDDARLLGVYRMKMRALNNLDVEQLQAALTLLYEGGRIPRHYQLAYVRSAQVILSDDDSQVVSFQPAQVRTVEDFDSTRQVAFVHINMANSRGNYNHYEGFSESGRPGAHLPWGLVRPDAGEHSRQRFSRHGMDLSLVDPKILEQMDKSNTTRKRVAEDRRIRNMCLSCQANGSKICSGERFETCKECASSGEECRWATWLPPRPIAKKASEITAADDFMDWENPDFSGIDLEATAKQYEAEPEPEKDYTLAIFVGRKSGGGFNDLLQLVPTLLQNRFYYEHFLGDPQLNTNPAADETGASIRPGGAGAPIRAFVLPLIRHGGKMVPCSTANLHDPFLLAMVNLIDASSTPQARKPLEIHFVLSGLAGFAVGIDRWRSFYQHVRGRDAQLAERIFLVPLAETHVIDGVGNHSLDPAGWTGYRWKGVQKHSLGDLLRRFDYRNAVNHMNLHHNMNFAMLQNHTTDLQDALIDAMDDEAAWRGAVLPAGMAGIVHARNHNRNKPFRLVL